MSEAVKQKALDLLLAGEVGGSKEVAKHLRNTGVTSKTLGNVTIIRGARTAASHRGIKKLRALRGKQKTAFGCHPTTASNFLQKEPNKKLEVSDVQ